MTKQQKQYEAILEKVTEALKHSPEELKKFFKMTELYGKAASDMTKDELSLVEAYIKSDLKTTELYGKAASDMTKDELSLVEAYVKSDLKTFTEEVKNSSQPFSESPFYKLVSESIWKNLAEVTDKTQLEWIEVMDDIQHKGVYEAGELVGLGNLVCEKCGHIEMITHVTRIEPCVKCGCKQFSRLPLNP
ncbi:zinc ribbon-containing protein [Photobacterium carnosum]|uniref:zinc ribbon-containing protein n=1 Tax=Photobacterium carnosum TaxID=2023717 RepID=UPI001E4E2557|nr:hypothetical protein [Photobacterium carnosum]MCD9531593.1 hypothetical protein [Photobacterium carnosum]MCF2155529.1 hypothetical protein [Photobacterium carnosum]MCF2217349.1 hypothetical protein [Photobacterium carnosum]